MQENSPISVALWSLSYLWRKKVEVNFFPWHVFTFILLQVQDTKVQGFVPGMKLESMDRTSLEADTYWVATVVMASGPLLLLRYDGYDDDRSGDFWCDAASDDLQPVGWCARNNHILIPPAGIWNNALEMFIVHSVQWCLHSILTHVGIRAYCGSCYWLQ